jgi:hypothetical protein
MYPLGGRGRKGGFRLPGQLATRVGEFAVRLGRSDGRGPMMPPGPEPEQGDGVRMRMTVYRVNPRTFERTFISETLVPFEKPSTRAWAELRVKYPPCECRRCVGGKGPAS